MVGREQPGTPRRHPEQDPVRHRLLAQLGPLLRRGGAGPRRQGGRGRPERRKPRRAGRRLRRRRAAPRCRAAPRNGVTGEAAVFAEVKRAAEHFGRLDVVVNNAGYARVGAVEELTEREGLGEVDSGRPAGVSTCGFPRAASRTRRARLRAPGSPQVHIQLRVAARISGNSGREDPVPASTARNFLRRTVELRSSVVGLRVTAIDRWLPGRRTGQLRHAEQVVREAELLSERAGPSPLCRPDRPRHARRRPRRRTPGSKTTPAPST